MYPINYQPRNGITWVQGLEGAKAFQLMPNSNIVLMDSENDGTFYIKVCDNIGMCNLRCFNYTEVVEQPTQKVDMSQYVTRNELKELLKEMQNEQPVQSVKSKPHETYNRADN